MNKSIFIVGFLWMNFVALAQTPVNDQVEQLASFQDNETFDYSELQEYFNFYAQHPIDINSKEIIRLHEIRLLSAMQLLNLQKHLNDHGPLLSIEELQSINGFDITTINHIKPFVTVEMAVSDVTIREILRKADHQLNLRYEQTLEPEYGYSDTSTQGYSGTPQQLLARYRFYDHTNFSAGITAEKDAGENLSTGADFYSAHLFLKTNTIIKSIALGDYYAGFGQGVIFNNGFSFGKTSDVLNIKQNISPLKPFVSANEAQYMRGAGITLGKNKTELTLFYSNKNIDGNVTFTDSATHKPLFFSSISESGLHRTSNELLDRKNIHEEIAGAHAGYKNTFFRNRSYCYLHRI